MERPVQIYLAGDPPALKPTPALEVVSSMADLKGLVGESPRAIWVDVAMEGQVDTQWLRERYRQGWPLFVFGKGAHDSLLRLLDLSTEKAQGSVAAYRQRSRDGADLLGVWTVMPAVPELLDLSRELLP